MCGIVGFTGNRQAAPILLDGLSKLEYRGYDSAGLAVRDGEALAQVVKAKGRLSNLIEKTDNGNALKGTCGIGHTDMFLTEYIILAIHLNSQGALSDVVLNKVKKNANLMI